MTKKILRSITDAFSGAGSAVRIGLGAIRRNPQVLIYPYLAATFILVTFPIVNGVVFEIWDSLWHSSVISLADQTPRNLRILLGLVTFSFFYTIFITAFFSAAMSAEILTKLENDKAPVTRGLSLVIKNFPRIAKFALLAIFFFPLSIIAQRHKLPKGLPHVLGSSLSLNMAQLAPVVLFEKKSVLASIRQSVDTLGGAWKENLVIKIGLWLLILLLLSIAFLPGLLEEHWVDSDTAQLIGALSAVLLSFVGYVVAKVIGGVFTATLYHQAQGRNKKQ